MVTNPRCADSSRNLRYRDRRRTVESAMRLTAWRLVKSFTSYAGRRKSGIG